MGQGISEVLPFAIGIAVNPKNLMLLLGAVFVAVASLPIFVAVVYDLLGGEQARVQLDEMKAWLTVHNSAVMAVLFLVFGVVLISKGLAPLTR
jgi:hypothetical protein